MLENTSINLGNFLLSMADAIEQSSPVIASHQVRTAFIAWRLCDAGGVAGPARERIFIGALLHDIGALTPEEKSRVHGFDQVNLEEHCRVGEMLLKSCPLLAPAAPAVRYHHRIWEDWETALETPQVFASQVIQFADLLERLVDRRRFILHQVGELKEKIGAYASRKINRKLVKLFEELADREDFWLDLMSPALPALMLRHGPLHRVEIDYDEAHGLSEMFREVIDSRSNFTATHSIGVAECATGLSRMFGMTGEEIRRMEMAANLHDLGMLTVPREIQDKPGRLTNDEYTVIKQHPYFTYSALTAIGGLDQIAEWAAFHHELLDGSGYPFHLRAERLSTGARIMAVADVFTALTEDRSYRKKMTRGEVQKNLLAMAKEKLLAKNLVDLLCDNYSEVAGNVAARKAVALENHRENPAGEEQPVSG